MTKKINLDNAYHVYRRLLTYVRRYWFMFLVAIVANMAYSGIDAYFTYLLKPLMNKGFISRDLHFIHWIPFVLIFIFIFRGLANFMANYAMTWVSRRVIMNLRQEVFQHLMKLPSRYFDHHSSGQILSKIIYNIEQVANAGTDALTSAVQSFVLIIGLFIVMFSVSWRLTLLYIIVMPVIALSIRYSSKRMRQLNKNIQASMGDVTHVAEEAIEGYRVIKTFGGEKYETDKFEKVTECNRFREMKVVVTKYVNVSFVQLVAAAVLALTIFLATHPGSSSMLSAGGFVSLFVAMVAILNPMKDLTTVNGSIQRGVAGAQSIFALLDEPKEEDHGTRELTRAKGHIAYQHVSFRYRDEGATVLQDIVLDIEPGKTIALVGRSGSGKSTLVSLLPRFYECMEGRILLDGHDLREYKLQALRQQFAFVSQHVTLFNDTIGNNIAYGKFNTISESAIWDAAEAAFATDFICRLPEGIHTMVGENGVLLSGGQRQRLAIARAIVKDAPILILDEATSALDSESERYIQSALEKLMKNRTTLVIAHRLSTIENADRIVVMDKGKIVESGTHQELLALNGHYASLHSMQFKEPKEVDWR